MDSEDAQHARTIGRRLRLIRKTRRKSLAVIAGLAGMSKSKLDRIERGEIALDKLSDIVALAGALQIAPGDLLRLPVPAPANGHTDATTKAVRQALNAIESDEPNGLVLPVTALREQVARIHTQLRACQFADVATDLPGLIRNLHTTLNTGSSHAVIHAKAALLQRRPEDAVAPTEAAAELAERFGTTSKPDRRGFLYSPTSAAINGMALALDNDEPDQAVQIARQTDPRQAPFPVNQTYWWINYGHALAKLPGRGADAMRALRTAERIFPTATLRNQTVREVLGEMLAHPQRDATGVELRGMAHRAGLLPM